MERVECTAWRVHQMMCDLNVARAELMADHSTFLDLDLTLLNRQLIRALLKGVEGMATRIFIAFAKQFGSHISWHVLLASRSM